MPDTKLSAETAAAALDGTEIVDGVQSAANVKITINQIRTRVLASGSTLVLDTGWVAGGGVTGGQFNYYGNGLILGSGSAVSFTTAGPDGVIDLVLTRGAAGILNVANPAAAGAVIELAEMTAPAAGAANTGRLFLQDNGSGKTQLMIIFSSGAAQQVAIQP